MLALHMLPGCLIQSACLRLELRHFHPGCQHPFHDYRYGQERPGLKARLEVSKRINYMIYIYIHGFFTVTDRLGWCCLKPRLQSRVDNANSLLRAWANSHCGYEMHRNTGKLYVVCLQSGGLFNQSLVGVAVFDSFLVRCIIHLESMFRKQCAAVELCVYNIYIYNEVLPWILGLLCFSTIYVTSQKCMWWLLVCMIWLNECLDSWYFWLLDQHKTSNQKQYQQIRTRFNK